jgi:hypothetical protein
VGVGIGVKANWASNRRLTAWPITSDEVDMGSAVWDFLSGFAAETD